MDTPFAAVSPAETDSRAFFAEAAACSRFARVSPSATDLHTLQILAAADTSAEKLADSEWAAMTAEVQHTDPDWAGIALEAAYSQPAKYPVQTDDGENTDQAPAWRPSPFF